MYPLVFNIHPQPKLCAQYALDASYSYYQQTSYAAFLFY